MTQKLADYMKDAREVSDKIKEALGDVVKAIVLFGSLAKGKKEPRDIDLFILVDDSEVPWSKDTVAEYDKKIREVLTKSKYAELYHIHIMPLSYFWEYLIMGDPVIVNILRYGIIFHDTGFLTPIQRLFMLGKIRPTRESVERLLSMATTTLEDVNRRILTIADRLYGAVLFLAQALIQTYGVHHTDPEEVALTLERLVKDEKLPQEIVKIYKKFYKLHKEMREGKRTTLSMDEVAQLYRDAIRYSEIVIPIVRKNIPSLP